MEPRHKPTTARIIVTRQCNRDCRYCVNKHSWVLDTAKKLDDLQRLQGFDNIVLTGGEPLLFPHKTLRLIQAIRAIRQPSPMCTSVQSQRIYLYTTKYTNNYEIYLAIDGLTYTVHAPLNPDDAKALLAMQDWLAFVKPKRPPGSLRLRLSPEIHEVTIWPHVWDRIESRPWLDADETCLPEGEELFILNQTLYHGYKTQEDY